VPDTLQIRDFTVDLGTDNRQHGLMQDILVLPLNQIYKCDLVCAPVAQHQAAHSHTSLSLADIPN
jgi:hypothetical protein